MSRSSLPGSGISGVAAALAPLLLAACLPSAPNALGSSPGLGAPAPTDPALAPMSYDTAAGDSTIGAVPTLWSKEYVNSGDKCEGEVKTFTAGEAVEVDSNDTLGSRAIGKNGEGKLCKAKVYKVVGDTPVYVWRVWSSNIANNEHGSWWLLESPMGSKAAFLKSTGACADMGKFDRITRCKLRRGIHFAVGPTQNKTCSKVGTSGGTGGVQTGKSALNQVVVPTDRYNPWTVWFSECDKPIENPLTDKAY
jgi:hypothetical protein